MFSKVLVGILFSGIAALAQSAPGKVSAPVAVIPFELVINHLYVQASVNNSSLLSVIVDSGSPDAVLDRSRSLQLGLPSSGDVVVPGFGSQELTTGRKLAINSMSLYGATLDKIAADSISLDSLSHVLGHTTDAIIGSDLFNKYVVEVDYLGRVLRLYDPDTYVARKESCRLPLSLDTYPTVHAELVDNDGNSTDAVLVVDTGSNYLAITKEFGDAHPRLPLNGATIEAASRKLISGVTSLRVGRVRSISFGGCTVEKPIAAFLQDISGSGVEEHKFSGTIGMNVLQYFTTVFDYRHHLVTFTRNRGDAGIGQYEMTGMHVLATGSSFHDFTVDYVLSNSPAHRSGILVGDKIDSVNRRLASKLTLEDIDKVFRRQGSLRLTILRDGKRLKKKLNLKPLI